MIKMNDMVLISLDDHIIEPPTMYDQHLTAAQKAFAPTFQTDDQGRDFWIYGDDRLGNVGLNAVVGRPKAEYGMEPLSLRDMRSGTFDAKARVDDMNVNGLLASLNFPTVVGFDGKGIMKGYSDRKQALQVLQAYNDWHIDEWCGAMPGRAIPLALIPMWSMDETVAEVRRVVAKGCHSISMSDNPTKGGLPSFHNEYWEPLWKICSENKVVISMHHGTGNAAIHPSMESPIDAWITCMPMSISLALADLLHLRAFETYKDLKFALIESYIGWIPFVLERADFVLQQHGEWTRSGFRGRKPSEVYRDHFLSTFVDDNSGLGLLDRMGAETVCFETDYPHSDSQWPRAPEVLFKSLADAKLSDEKIDLITHANAMREYSFDPFSVLGGRQHCTVGALRAQAGDVDVTEVSKGGARPLGWDVEGYRVTSGDVMVLFENAAKDAESRRANKKPTKESNTLLAYTGE